MSDVKNPLNALVVNPGLGKNGTAYSPDEIIKYLGTFQHNETSR